MQSSTVASHPKRAFLLTALGRWSDARDLTIEKMKLKHGDTLPVFTSVLHELAGAVEDVFSDRPTHTFEVLLQGAIEHEDPDAHEGRIKLVTQIYFNILQAKRDIADKEEAMLSRCRDMQAEYTEKINKLRKSVQRSVTTRGQLSRDREAAFTAISSAVEKVIAIMKSIESTVTTGKKRFLANKKEAADCLSTSQDLLRSFTLSKAKKREWEQRRSIFQQILMTIDRVKTVVHSRGQNGGETPRDTRITALLQEASELISKVDNTEGRWSEHVTTMNNLAAMVANVTIPDEVAPRRKGGASCDCERTKATKPPPPPSPSPPPPPVITTLTPEPVRSAPAAVPLSLRAPSFSLSPSGFSTGSRLNLLAVEEKTERIDEIPRVDMHGDCERLQKKFVLLSEVVERVSEGVLQTIRKKVPTVTGAGVISPHEYSGAPAVSPRRAAAAAAEAREMLFSSALSLHAEKFEKRFKDLVQRLAMVRQNIEMSGFAPIEDVEEATITEFWNVEFNEADECVSVPELTCFIRTVHDELLEAKHAVKVAGEGCVSPCLPTSPNISNTKAVSMKNIVERKMTKKTLRIKEDDKENDTDTHSAMSKGMSLKALGERRTTKRTLRIANKEDDKEEDTLPATISKFMSMKNMGERRSTKRTLRIKEDDKEKEEETPPAGTGTARVGGIATIFKVVKMKSALKKTVALKSAKGETPPPRTSFSPHASFSPVVAQQPLCNDQGGGGGQVDIATSQRLTEIISSIERKLQGMGERCNTRNASKHFSAKFSMKKVKSQNIPAVNDSILDGFNDITTEKSIVVDQVPYDFADEFESESESEAESSDSEFCEDPHMRLTAALGQVELMNAHVDDFQKKVEELLGRQPSQEDGFTYLHVQSDQLVLFVQKICLSPGLLQTALANPALCNQDVPEVITAVHDDATSVADEMARVVEDIKLILQVRKEKESGGADSSDADYLFDLTTLESVIHNFRSDTEGLDPHMFESEEQKRKLELKRSVKEAKRLPVAKLSFTSNSAHRLFLLLQVRKMFVDNKEALELLSKKKRGFCGSTPSHGSPEVLRSLNKTYDRLRTELNAEVCRERVFFYSNGAERAPRPTLSRQQTMRQVDPSEERSRCVRELVTNVRHALEGVHCRFGLRQFVDASEGIRKLSNKFESEVAGKTEQAISDLVRRTRDFVNEVEKRVGPQCKAAFSDELNEALTAIDTDLQEDMSRLQSAAEATSLSPFPMSPVASFRMGSDVSRLSMCLPPVAVTPEVHDTFQSIPLISQRDVPIEETPDVTPEQCVDFCNKVLRCAAPLRQADDLLAELAKEAALAAADNPALEMRDSMCEHIQDLRVQLQGVVGKHDVYFLSEIMENLQQTASIVKEIHNWEDHPAGCNTHAKQLDECVKRMERSTMTRQGCWDEARLSLLGLRKDGWEKLSDHIRNFCVDHIFKPTLQNQSFELRKFEDHISLMKSPKVYFTSEVPEAEAGVLPHISETGSITLPVVDEAAMEAAEEELKHIKPHRPRTARLQAPREEKRRTPIGEGCASVNPVVFTADFASLNVASPHSPGKVVRPDWRQLLNDGQGVTPPRGLTIHSARGEYEKVPGGKRGGGSAKGGASVVGPEFLESLRKMRVSLTQEDDDEIARRRPPSTARPVSSRGEKV